MIHSTPAVIEHFTGFIEIDHSEAYRLYISPSVLSAIEGPISRDGYAESQTPDCGHIVLTGNDISPVLCVTNSEGLECEVKLDLASSKCLVDSLLVATN